MDDVALVAAMYADGDALVAAVEQAPDVAVPTCPGWTMRQLLHHVAGVHRWCTEIVRQGVHIRRRDLPHMDVTAPIGDLAGWYRDGLQQLAATLSSADPETTTWTFAGSGDRRVAWWTRRQACETATHRWDAQHALRPGGAAAIDSGVAVAGVAEYVTDFLAGALEDAGVELHGTLHLHATDVEAGCEWLVDFDTTPLTVTAGHAKADTAVRAPVSDLLLWMCNRLAAGGARIDVFGSPDPVTVWPRLTL